MSKIFYIDCGGKNPEYIFGSEHWQLLSGSVSSLKLFSFADMMVVVLNYWDNTNLHAINTTINRLAVKHVDLRAYQD